MEERESSIRSPSEDLDTNAGAFPQESPIAGLGSNTQHRSDSVTFVDHLRNQYALPFQDCKTWESFEGLVKTIYRRRRDRNEDQLWNDFQDGKYDIISKNRKAIIPEVWASIIKPRTFVQIRFWSPVPIYEDIDVEEVDLEDNDLEDDDLEDDNPNDDSPNDDNSKNDNPKDDNSKDDNPKDDNSKDDNPKDDNSKDDDLKDNVVREDVSGSPLYIPYIRTRRTRSSNSSSSSTSTLGTTSPTSQKTEDEEDFVAKPIRNVTQPTDDDGNELSFIVNTKHELEHVRSHEESSCSGEGSKKTWNFPKKNIKNYRITKVVRLTAERRTSLHVYTLPGPESPSTSSSVDIRWHHLFADELNFDYFKNTCLAMQGLSEKLRILIKKMLEKIEQEKVKAFSDGKFIDPGTVLRCEESCQSDPQSVIFTCIPYLELQAPSQNALEHGDQAYPPRTLMQTYYPHEPVRNRDAEQAYKKFGNEKSGNIIHVPTLWMMIIGTHVVVTCGHKPLSNEFVRSIKFIKEDSKRLDPQGGDDNTLTNIKLTDWYDRQILYPTDECRTYFEMEQKLKELRYATNRLIYRKDLQLVWSSHQGERKIAPKDWPSVIKSQNGTFINLSVLDKKKATTLTEESLNVKPARLLATTFAKSSVLPFFHWPPAKKHDNPEDFKNTDIKRVMNRLGFVEKAMMSETLPNCNITNAVDSTFTSTHYYESLPEDTVERVKSNFASLVQNPGSVEETTVERTYHQNVVFTQCSTLGTKATELINVVCDTVNLFVVDLDTSTLLKKLWGAMARISKLVNEIQDQDPYKVDVGRPATSEDEVSAIEAGPWIIRKYDRKAREKDCVQQPSGDDAFKSSIRKCIYCRISQSYKSPQEAAEHLRNHLATVQSEQSNTSTATTTRKEPILEDWIRSDTQQKLEERNAGAISILTLATEAALTLLKNVRELIEGVVDENGKLSDRYKFPRNLLETFRRLIAFYLAIEQALYRTGENFPGKVKKGDSSPSPSSSSGLKMLKRYSHQPLYHNDRSLGKVKDVDSSLPLSSSICLEVLERFSRSVNTSILTTRNDLCEMVRSSTPIDISKQLACGPEYLSAWLMRELLVKPLENSMTVSDMYREYLSTIQFQVNHRPGKRLLRSITLLKEELQILSEVIAWQCKLITNYSRILDDSTYEKDIPHRRAMYPFELALLNLVLKNLSVTREELINQIQRCGPLSESTKQSAEINEEDHGKAILAFTVVTLIFLPLSFVTSYLGMNTSDIRDMGNRQSLFWEIAIPLTTVTMGAVLLMAYNGDILRDTLSSLYRLLTGKQDQSISTRGISVAERGHDGRPASKSSSALDYKSLADEAQFTTPKPEYSVHDFTRSKLVDDRYVSNRDRFVTRPEHMRARVVIEESTDEGGMTGKAHSSRLPEYKWRKNKRNSRRHLEDDLSFDYKRLGRERRERRERKFDNDSDDDWRLPIRERMRRFDNDNDDDWDLPIRERMRRFDNKSRIYR